MEISIRTGQVTENPAGAPKVRPEKPTTAGEFASFKALTQRLVNVPKAEIDKRRKAES